MTALRAGVVCERCEALSPFGAPRCVLCGAFWSWSEPAGGGVGTPGPAAVSRGFEAPPRKPARASTEEEPMEQAQGYVCAECSSPVPSGHKFCGACGATVPDDVQNMREEYFGRAQTPGTARLVVVRGQEGSSEGMTYLLHGREHIAGRQGDHVVFPDDPWVSPRHANFFYRDGSLVVRDEQSANGVYVRVTRPTPVSDGDRFLCGEQVFRVEVTSDDPAGVGEDGTYFYASPRRPSAFRLVQMLEGGADGMVCGAHDDVCRVGREQADLNFPHDIYMSGRHAHLEQRGDDTLLVDDGSRNGTYLKIRGEQALADGDYLFIGKELLRVDVTS